MVSEDNSFDVIDDASFHDEAAVKFVEAYKAVGNSGESNVFYLIAVQWMDKFRNFLNDPQNIYPGQVVNIPLIETDNADYNWVAQDSLSLEDDIEKDPEAAARKALISQRLKQGMVENNDFVFVNAEQWNLLNNYFNADIIIPRLMDSSSRLIEVYPFSQKVYIKHHSGKQERKIIVGSKFVSLKEFLGEIGEQTSRVYIIDDADKDGETDLQLFDTVFEILGSGDDDVFVQLVDQEDGDACSDTAMDGDNASQVENMIVDDDLFMGIDTIGTNHNVAATNSIVPYNGPSSPIAQDSVETSSTQIERSPYFKSSLNSNSMPKGLSNLGNTCFMNATLQCFASVEPLVKYYTQDIFMRDMNVNNILGTGGKLAKAFSDVLKDLLSSSSNSSGWMGAVSPREFKYVLGQFASQFIGYDQHDCQELATYLLDALHEDCNLIEKKPYVEKPEKKESETDADAAEIAWKAHMKRENSYIVDNFGFLMKSHVECPVSQKVSTTFDPMVYLSVPIPCSNETVISLTYVPIHGKNREIKMKLEKGVKFSVLLEKLSEIVEVASDDLCITDLWNMEVYKFYESSDSIDEIGSSDTPFVFQLSPLKSIDVSIDKTRHIDVSLWLEAPDLTKFSIGDIDVILGSFESHSEAIGLNSNHKNILRGFLNRSIVTKYGARNRSFGDTVDYLNELRSLYKSSSNPQDPESTKVIYSALLLHKEALKNPVLVSVIIQKLNRNSSLSSSSRYKDGGFRNRIGTNNKLAVRVLRMPVQTSLSQLRQTLNFHYGHLWDTQAFTNEYNESCSRLTARELAIQAMMDKNTNEENKCDERVSAVDHVLVEGSTTVREGLTNSDCSLQEQFQADKAESLRMRTEPKQLGNNVPLEIFQRLPLTTSTSKHSSFNSKPLGSLEVEGVSELSKDNISLMPVADPEEETKSIGEILHKQSCIYVNIPHPLIDFFDTNQLSYVEEFQSMDSDEDNKPQLSLYDCIDAFTLREQLPISESYYCSHCKDHVQAYKECGVYFAPNVLVIHLKRFQFSSISHRRDKIEAHVDFPLRNLDLTDIVIKKEASMKPDCVNNLPPIYDLVAVSNHFGGLGGGHYTAHGKRGDQWYYFDDSRVSRVTDESNIISSAAYVLYYVRQGLKVPDQILKQELSEMIDRRSVDNLAMADIKLPSKALTTHPTAAMIREVKEEDNA